MTGPRLTREQWAVAKQRLQERAWELGHFEGVPFGSGRTMTLATGHPLKAQLEALAQQSAEDGRDFTCRTADVDETVSIRNQWYSPRLRRTVFIYNEQGRVRWCLSEPFDLDGLHRLNLLCNTLTCSLEWELDAELAALARLQATVSTHQFKLYLLTGTFGETSHGSGTFYLFRRLRPTLALKEWQGKMRFLSALCLHPLGFHDDTFAGAMVPTDDVLAHLLLMRGDEHLFWRRSNQHQLYEREAGV